MLSSQPDTGPPMTDDTGIATMNHAIMRVRYCAGKPGPEVEGHARKEASFSRAQEQAERIEAAGTHRQRGRRRDEPPRDHDARQPHARTDAVEHEVARDLEEAVAEEEDARAEPELRGRQPDRLVHRQPGEADVVAIEVVEDVS